MQFPTLLSESADLSDDTLLVYTNHLQKLRDDMLKRLADLQQLRVHAWGVDPFSSDVDSVPVLMQEQLVDLKHDVQAEPRFRQGGYLAERCRGVDPGGGGGGVRGVHPPRQILLLIV